MRILVAGTQRSGSTWTSRVLGCAPNTRIVNEPDSFVSDLAAAPTVKELGYMPVLAPGDEAPQAYERVWQFAFVGGWPWDRWRPAIALGRQIRRLPSSVRDPFITSLMRATGRTRPRPEHVIVKSVNSCFSLEWIVGRFTPKVVVTVRNPMAVVSSWKDIGITAPYLATHPRLRERYIDAYGLPEPPASPADELEQVAWGVGLQAFALKLACDRHPEWLVVQHEAMCADPTNAFRALYTDLGLTWIPAADRYLQSVNQPGEGFATSRVTQDAPHRWRSRLSRQEKTAVQRVLGQFPVALEPA